MKKLFAGLALFMFGITQAYAGNGTVIFSAVQKMERGEQLNAEEIMAVRAALQPQLNPENSQYIDIDGELFRLEPVQKDTLNIKLPDQESAAR